MIGRRSSIVALTVGGNGLGLVRDLFLAALFGAGAATDAFLAAWTVPETASPLLLEGLMALIGIPYLTRAVVAGRAEEAVARTFYPALLGLSVIALAVVAGAELLVRVTVPGIADPSLAVSCVRLAAPTIPFLGAAGYLSALLRAHDHQVRPAGVYLAYNVGIIATMLLGAPVWGIRAAAAGLSVGAATMCLLLLPPVLRAVGLPKWSRTRRRQWTPALAMAAPLLCYLLARQGQTFVERFFASLLAPGSISQLNYAQKVGQVPGTVAVALALAGFAQIARHTAGGRSAEAADAVAHGLRSVLALVIPGAAALVVLAPLVVAVLFERGRFTSADTAGTAAVLQVYVLGLPGQALVSSLVIAVAGLAGSRWLAPAAAGACLAVTAAVAAALSPAFGIRGIAAADAVGIWVAAAILIRGVWRGFGGDRPEGTIAAVARTTAAGAVGAAAAGLVLFAPGGPAYVRLAAALVLGTGVGLSVAALLRADDLLALLPRRIRAVLPVRSAPSPGAQSSPGAESSSGGPT